jgi:TRAP-type C4-dicarboxylate transport system permease small subunit
MIGTMLFVVVLQVFCRYVLNSALSWPEELARFLMIWSGMLAAIYAFHEGSHVGVTFIITKFRNSVTRAIVVISQTLIILFLFFLTYEGTAVLSQFLDLRSAALRIPMVIVYSAVPAATFLMILVSLKLIYNALFEKADRKP